jgi:hypothetical protein
MLTMALAVPHERDDEIFAFRHMLLMLFILIIHVPPHFTAYMGPKLVFVSS